MGSNRWTVAAVAAASALCLLLGACNPQRAAGLEEGLSTEADVRREFGEPAAVLNAPDGSRIFEYPRQPEGQTNYFISPARTATKLSSVAQAHAQQRKAFDRRVVEAPVGQRRPPLRTALGRPAAHGTGRA